MASIYKAQNRNEFQFHYGSVKRELIALLEVVKTIFQFHYGSVKRK